MIIIIYIWVIRGVPSDDAFPHDKCSRILASNFRVSSSSSHTFATDVVVGLLFKVFDGLRESAYKRQIPTANRSLSLFPHHV